MQHVWKIKSTYLLFNFFRVTHPMEPNFSLIFFGTFAPKKAKKKKRKNGTGGKGEIA